MRGLFGQLCGNADDIGRVFQPCKAEVQPGEQIRRSLSTRLENHPWAMRNERLSQTLEYIEFVSLRVDLDQGNAIGNTECVDRNSKCLYDILPGRGSSNARLIIIDKAIRKSRHRHRHHMC